VLCTRNKYLSLSGRTAGARLLSSNGPLLGFAAVDQELFILMPLFNARVLGGCWREGGTEGEGEDWRDGVSLYSGGERRRERESVYVYSCYCLCVVVCFCV
jgi:hypothetical protein